jgi:AcrR family transcriptional regulator
MGHKHTKDEILAGAMEAALADGLSRLTFGRVAKHLGISDRVVVYYFPSKDDLISEVLIVLGINLQSALASAFEQGATDHTDLARTAWPILSAPEHDAVFSLFFEASGLAATGREPYHSVVKQLIDAWVEWLMGFLTGPTETRQSEAEAAVAVIDGLLLLRKVGGSAAADRAAARLWLN